jgi:hypothetical protein
MFLGEFLQYADNFTFENFVFECKFKYKLLTFWKFSQNFQNHQIGANKNP